MDFYITKEEIVSSLNATLGVVEKRQTLPILANVLFEVDESTLKTHSNGFRIRNINLFQQYLILKVEEGQQPQQKNSASFVDCLKREMRFIFFLMETT
jgi:DNA polymerase III sliding clamp (beta) subunit (PCNA family)